MSTSNIPSVDRPLSVAAYIRVSSERQASDEHYSIPEQTDRIKAYCAAKGWSLVKIYTDPGYSGKDLNRPAMQQLIAECKRYDLILVNKLDRLSRSQKDTLHLIEDVFMANGVQFASMTENFDTTTPLGMAMVGILSTFAQLERSQIKERMMTGKIGRAKKGLYHGSDAIPIGYNYQNGRLIVDEEGAELVREIYNLFLSGVSFNQIRVRMKKKSDLRVWDIKTITRIITNPVYVGKICFSHEVYDGQHEAIIDDATFERAQNHYALLEKSNPMWRSRSRKLLTGFIFCGECGGRYGISIAHTSKGGKKYCYQYYQCYNRPHKICSNKIYRQDWLDGYIQNQIEHLNIDEVREEKRPADHSKEIARLEKQKNKLIDLYAIDGIDLEHLREKIAVIDKRLTPLIAPPKEPQGLPLDEARNLVQSSRDVFAKGDMEESRRLVGSLVKKIMLHRDRIQIEWNF